MSANQRLGFHHWVASLKREAPSAPGVSNAPRSAAPPATSTAPPAKPDVSSVPAPRASDDDDATRVHHIPKEIIHRMRERAASEAPKTPQDERTCVFRAPPELLERAKRAQATSESPTEGLADPEPSLLAEGDFGEMPEAKSGVSLRLQEPPPTVQPLDPPPVVEDPVDDVTEPLGIEIDASTSAGLDADAPLRSHVAAPASVNEAASAPPSEASLERLSDVPAFRRPLAGKLWLAALMAVVAVLVVWSTR
jgi:hypothetical protein